ncbi:alpha/beta hydrolase family protein [Methanothrix soehngenii]|uniref:alpha/beta hydrolase family protein n=1 Tax=Methanothrix soehngenii TaxID=2223 RepID=UPI00300DBB09
MEWTSAACLISPPARENIPPYDHWDRVRWTNFVGNISTKEGRELLSERSPLNYANRVRRPLLIAQGANDPIVNQSESAQMVLAMQERNLSVTYVLFPDEGHGFVRPKNNIAFYAVAEAFFAKHLGGRFEPIDKDFQGSAITVPVGAEEVPGLEAALNGSDYHNLPEKSGK